MLNYTNQEIQGESIQGLELLQSNGKYKIKKRNYIGKEPGPFYVYETIAIICKKLGIDPFLELNRCDDEVGELTHFQRAFMLRSSFMNAMIGTQASIQPSEVASHKGHSSNVYEVNVHIGMYKRPDEKILFGKVQGRDHSYRPTCGALAAILNHFENGTEHEVYKYYEPNGNEVKIPVATADGKDFNFLGKLYHDLSQYKAEILKEMNKEGIDSDQRYSKGMYLLAQKNLQKQVDRQIEILIKHKSHNKILIVGTISFNKYKYPDTMVLGSLHVIESGNAIDLSKQEF